MADGNLYAAHHQWSTRPPDERFWSLAELASYLDARTASTVQRVIDARDLTVIDVGTDLAIRTNDGESKLTHYTFDQLCGYASAPADFLRRLGPEMAVPVLNRALEPFRGRSKVTAGQVVPERLQVLASGQYARAITTDTYDLVWDREIVGAVRRYLPGWRPPPARPTGQRGERTRLATADDVIRYGSSLSVREGDPIAPAGIYAGDRDMFLFLVSEGVEGGADLEIPGGGILNRGIFVQNSEVGSGMALRITSFFYDFVCGNHIVWSARNVQRRTVRRRKSEIVARGRTLDRARNLILDVHEAEDDRADWARTIGAARGKTLEIDEFYDLSKKLGVQSVLTRTALEAGYEIAEQTPRYGDPRSVWAMVNGLTEYSQRLDYTSQRHSLDVAAGKLLATVDA